MGFDARAHRTENSDLLTPANVAKLKASWEKYWEQDKANLRRKDAREPVDDEVFASRF